MLLVAERVSTTWAQLNIAEKLSLTLILKIIVNDSFPSSESESLFCKLERQNQCQCWMWRQVNIVYVMIIAGPVNSQLVQNRKSLASLGQNIQWQQPLYLYITWSSSVLMHNRLLLIAFCEDCCTSENWRVLVVL